MDKWLISHYKQIIELKKSIQPAVDAYEKVKPALEYRKILSDRMALWKEMPPEIKELVVLEDEEWENLDDGYLDKEHEPTYTDFDKRIINYLRQIYKTDRAKYKKILAKVELEKELHQKAREVQAQKGKPGRRSDPLYDRVHEKMIQEDLSLEEAFDYFCQEAEIEAPDKHLRKAFNAAMWRRYEKIRNSS